MNIFSYLRLKHHIRRQIRLCYKYPQYKSAIYVTNSHKMSKICEIVNSLIAKRERFNKLRTKFSKYQTACDWHFDNRSYLSCIVVYRETYRHRLHSLIVDKDLSKDVKEMVIAPTVTVYQTKKKPSRFDMVKVNVFCYLVRRYWAEIPIKITARDTLQATTERRDYKV